MTIDHIICQVLRVPSVEKKTASSQDVVLVRAISSDGLEGIGEADASPEVVKAIVDAPFSHNIGGAAQPQADAVVLTSMRLAVPPSSVGEKFDCLVGPMIDEAELLAVKIQNLRRTRDLLLPRLLSGQATLSPPASPRGRGVALASAERAEK